MGWKARSGLEWTAFIAAWLKQKDDYGSKPLINGKDEDVRLN